MIQQRGRISIETVGLIVLIVSVLLVAYELYQSRQLSVSDRLTAAADVETALRELVTQNSVIWHKGCIGEELLPHEQTTFDHIVFSLQYRSFTLWSISQTGASDVPPSATVRRMATSVRDYPGFRASFEKYASGYEAQTKDDRWVVYSDSVFEMARRTSARLENEKIACGL